MLSVFRILALAAVAAFVTTGATIAQQSAPPQPAMSAPAKPAAKHHSECKKNGGCPNKQKKHAKAGATMPQPAPSV